MHYHIHYPFEHVGVELKRNGPLLPEIVVGQGQRLFGWLQIFSPNTGIWKDVVTCPVLFNSKNWLMHILSSIEYFPTFFFLSLL